MMTKYFLSFLISFMAIDCQKKVKEPEVIKQTAVKTVQFKSMDGITITADYYSKGNPDAPLILLFHQARFSRGEYVETAPKLVDLGFNCLAIDQRSGNEINGVVNETHKQAVAKGLPTEYPDALPDLEAALDYAITDLKASKITIWGSSYSAALTFVLVAKHPEHINGIIAFSPGDYFTFENQSISDFAKKVKCPVFITSAKNEISKWKPIFDAIIPSLYKVGFIPDGEGVHGSRALWNDNANYQEYWEALETYLKKIYLKR